MKYAALLSAAFLLVFGVAASAPAQAEDKSDTIRDLLLLVQAKQPETQVTLQINTTGYFPYGQISHIGDDYACVMRDGQNGVNHFNVEVCVPLRRIIGVEMNPGIHR